jgi:hypothetical protein
MACCADRFGPSLPASQRLSLTDGFLAQFPGVDGFWAPSRAMLALIRRSASSKVASASSLAFSASPSASLDSADRDLDLGDRRSSLLLSPLVLRLCSRVALERCLCLQLTVRLFQVVAPRSFNLLFQNAKGIDSLVGGRSNFLFFHKPPPNTPVLDDVHQCLASSTGISFCIWGQSPLSPDYARRNSESSQKLAAIRAENDVTTHL